MSEIKDIRIEEFDYPLPEERIAKHPLAQRDRCKLLVRRGDGSLEEHLFYQLPDLLPQGSMLVYNNTRVINARLRFHKGEDATGALVEVFCLEPVDPADYAQSFAATGSCTWLCLVGNSKRWKDQPLRQTIKAGDARVVLTAERVAKEETASKVRFSWDNPEVSFSQIIEAAGEIPIPPYLNRCTEAADSADYQTVYSRIEGSVAAPTAGLHFTPEVLAAIDGKGMLRRELTLHVGAGTFKPVKSESIGDHPMHSEFIAVKRNLIRELATVHPKVIAVGTTSVRTLESLYHIGCLMAQGRDWTEVPQWYPYEPGHPQLSVAQSMARILEHLDSSGSDVLIASTRIIIAPGYTYRMVDGMVTNFHQPQSTLLLLVSAFVDGDWRKIYDFALDRDYRFLSYGDAMLLL